MCGIAGVFDLAGRRRTERAVLERMIGTLTHRGPDGLGLHHTPDFALAFRRLSIVDLAGGHQPLTNEDGTIVSACNGEIYNHRELREALVRQGHRFRTRCDVEIVPHLYEEYGPCFADRLNGQFAFVIYDAKARRLIAARDHFGIVPYFYTFVDGLFVFASEVKALLRHPAVPRAVDVLGLDQVWSFTGTVSPRTMFKGVNSLPAGCLLMADADGVRTKQYWDLIYPPQDQQEPAGASESETLERLDELLDRAVARRLQADVPVAVAVSGGLDSSLIAAKARALSPDVHDAFSMNFPDPELSEARYQQLVTNHLSLRHHSRVFGDGEVGERLARVIWHCECPIKEFLDAAALALSESIRGGGYKVVLSGQGADELFAGYVGYRFDAFHATRASQAPSPRELAIRRSLWGDETFLYEKDQAALLPAKRSLFSRALQDAIGELGCLAEPLIDPEKIRGRHPVHRRSYVDFKLRLADHLLADLGDRMSLGNSVESRYPFLDQELVEAVRLLPPHFKLNGYEDKYALKKLGSRCLPRQILIREKQGFAAPGSPVLLRRRDEVVSDLLSPDRLAREGFFDPAAVTALRTRYEHPDFKLNAPFEDDLLALVLTFGLFLNTFDLPALS